MTADYYFEADEDYIEWVSQLQFKTLSLATIVNGQPLLMPLEAFKWSDAAMTRGRNSGLSLLLTSVQSPPPPFNWASPSPTFATGSSIRATRSSALKRVKTWLRNFGSSRTPR